MTVRPGHPWVGRDLGEAMGGGRLSGKAFVGGMSVTPALSFGRWLARRLAGAA